MDGMGIAWSISCSHLCAKLPASNLRASIPKLTEFLFVRELGSAGHWEPFVSTFGRRFPRTWHGIPHVISNPSFFEGLEPFDFFPMGVLGVQKGGLFLKKMGPKIQGSSHLVFSGGAKKLGDVAIS